MYQWFNWIVECTVNSQTETGDRNLGMIISDITPQRAEYRTTFVQNFSSICTVAVYMPRRTARSKLTHGNCEGSKSFGRVLHVQLMI